MKKNLTAITLVVPLLSLAASDALFGEPKIIECPNKVECKGQILSKEHGYMYHGRQSNAPELKQYHCSSGGWHGVIWAGEKKPGEKVPETIQLTSPEAIQNTHRYSGPNFCQYIHDGSKVELESSQVNMYCSPYPEKGKATGWKCGQ